MPTNLEGNVLEVALVDVGVLALEVARVFGVNPDLRGGIGGASRRLKVLPRLTLKAIGLRLGVSSGTISRWIDSSLRSMPELQNIWRLYSQIGSVLGVAITVGLLGHAGLQRADFDTLYGLHVALALLTGLLCLPVATRPR